MRRAFLIAASAVSIASLVAACNGNDPPDPTPIVGFITSASGGNAPLVSDGDDPEDFGTGFSIDAVLGSADVILTNQPWKCFAPTADFPTFDFEATDRATYGLFVQMSPIVWSTGAIAIDGENVKVVLSLADRFGVATNGTLVLTTTGNMADTAGQNCSFRLENVSLFGEKN